MRWTSGAGVVLATAAGAGACGRDAAEVRAEPVRAPEAAPSDTAAVVPSPQVSGTAPVGAKVVAPPSAAPAQIVIAPAIPALEEGNMDHAYVFGWSRDGSVLGYCATSGGSGTSWCETMRPGGKPQRFDDVGAKDAPDQPDPVRHAALERRVKTLGLGAHATTWRFGGEVQLTWTDVPGDQMHVPPVPGLLRVGARVRSEPAAFAVTLAYLGEGGHHDRIHAETIAVSPDGSYLGVVGHAFAGEFSDELLLAIVPTSEVVGRAYDEAAASHERRGDARRVEKLRAKAAAARRSVVR